MIVVVITKINQNKAFASSPEFIQERKRKSFTMMELQKTKDSSRKKEFLVRFVQTGDF
jgi:hypothetical protein